MRPDAIRNGAVRPADRIRRACVRVAVAGGLLFAGWLLATALSGAQADVLPESEPAPPQAGVAGLLDRAVPEVLGTGRDAAEPLGSLAPAADLVRTLAGRDGLLDRPVTALAEATGRPVPEVRPAAWHTMPHQVLATGETLADGVGPVVRVRSADRSQQAGTPAPDHCGGCAPRPSTQVPGFPSPVDGKPGGGDDLAPGQQHFQPAGLAAVLTIDPPAFAAPAPTAYRGPAATGSPADPAVSPD